MSSKSLGQIIKDKTFEKKKITTYTLGATLRSD